MVKSMTGFGRGKYFENGLEVTVEIKSVNHRYFEFSARMPRGYAFLEEKLKSFCASRVSRGKVEISVSIFDGGNNNTEIEINKDYADAYITALKKLSARYHIKNNVKVADLVGNSELFTVKRNTISDEVITEAVLSAANEAMEGFVSMRLAEGERLADDVVSRTEKILDLVEVVEKRSPETLAAYRERLEQKIKELLGSTEIDNQRVLTETAIFADKIAVAEETVRLRSHIKQFRELFGANEPIGRKLDFLVQEMNREANTIGSKAQDIEITRTVVDIKSEIEKIREQIQNIE